MSHAKLDAMAASPGHNQELSFCPPPATSCDACAKWSPGFMKLWAGVDTTRKPWQQCPGTELQQQTRCTLVVYPVGHLLNILCTSSLAALPGVGCP